MKKRDEFKLDISDEKWIYTSENEDGISINNYYIDNPNMMLGKMELQSTAYGYDNTLSPIDEDIKELIIRYDNETYFNEKVSMMPFASDRSGFDIAKAIQDLKK